MQNSLAAARRNTFVETALRGKLRIGDTVNVRHRVTGTDAFGHRFSTIVDVNVGRRERIGDMRDRAAAAAADVAISYGVQVESVEVASGTYTG